VCVAVALLLENGRFFWAHGQDGASFEADAQEPHGVVPHSVKLGARQELPKDSWVNLCGKQNFAAIDVANSGKKTLVHKQQADRFL